jgi:isopentenyl-diphosphate Delta-isomerase
MKNYHVILVDENDHQIGKEEIIVAHRGVGILHRAISAFAYRKSEGHVEFLFQKRSTAKLLWPGFWTNTVCTHPQENEAYETCVVRRLNEEMGIIVSESSLQRLYQFVYQANFTEKYSEHELDTVYIVAWDGRVSDNPDEISAYRWIGFDELRKEIHDNPDQFTPWVKIIVRDERFISAISMV